MKFVFLPLSAVLVAGLACSVSAAVQDSQFPPKTVRDLISVCAPTSDDPKMTGAINYCHGFVEGSVIVEIAHGQQRHARKLFCLPSPPPASDSELTSFVSWANQVPARFDEPAVDGMFLYLAQKYPCTK
jgi:Rap1a immunity proteins